MKLLKTTTIQLSKQQILPVLTLIALLLLMAIQVDYIWKAARLEQQNFNHRAMMALKDTREEMARRVPTCNNMENYLCGIKCEEEEKKKAAAEVDSILRSKLALYQINVDYTFQISGTLQTEATDKKLAPACYLQNLNGVLKKNGIQMRLEFPDRNQFVLKQVSGIFGLSIVFIGFVAISYILSQQMSAKIKRQMQHTQEFINNLVHEFQTPLANIRFASSLIKKRVNDDTKVHDYTNIILTEDKKMEHLVQEILKVACTPKPSTEEQVHIHEIIQRTVNELKFSIEQSNGQIALDLLANNDSVTAEANEIQRVISNLIDNAIKYAKDKPEVHIKTENKGEMLLLQVHDKGIGISSKDLPRVFDQYYRVSTGNVHNVKGFGLGLTYVKKVIEKYGGQVSVKSRPNIETEFSIEIPLD